MHTEERTTPQVRLLHALFEHQARLHPDEVALEVPGAAPGVPPTRWTYAELEVRASTLAARLAPFVHGECVVAVLLPRAGPWLHTAQLGVMKAGAAWTCIEPGLATERLRYLLQDSCAAAVIAEPSEHAALAAAGFPLERVLAPSSPPLPAAAAPAWLGPETLAYVIYTSGTTGQPKGVMIEHRSIANLISADAEYFDLGPGDRVAQTSSCSYDSSVEEIWLAWATGATVVVVEDDLVRSGPDLLPWLRQQRISVWCPAPTLLRMTGCEDPQRELPGVRLLYVGGEELTADIAARWAPGRRLENGYGPTECTVTVVRTPVRAGVPVTIGRPVRGNRAHVVDAALGEVPDGQVGELVIAGESVARGYLGRPDLTAERFLDHPVHGRIYRTGDLVRRLPDGDLAYLGRADTQVKIRGHRIELTAIETELCRIPGIVEAACKVQTSHGVSELVAFVVMSGAGEPDADALRRALARTLPEPMLPARFARLAELPRGALSGKLDRKALPELEPEVAAVRHGRAPAGELELVVAGAIRRHVPVPDAVDAESDFFLDLGGNSLLAAQVVSDLRRDPRTVQLTVRDLYEARTVEALARRAHTMPHASPAPLALPSGVRVSRHAAWTVFAQGLVLALALLVTVNVVGFAAFELLPAIVARTGVTWFVVLLPSLLLGAALAWTGVAALLTLASKRLLIGRYEAGRHPYQGSMYLRHWIVQLFARSLPWDLLESTGLRVQLLRALGARIGNEVHLHRGVALHQGGWDLLEIGEGATLGRDVSLGLVTYDQQQLVFAPVRIGAEATLDTRARMGPGSVLGDGAFLGALAWLAHDTTVPPGERWDGVPAHPHGMAPPAPTGSRESARPGALHTLLLLSAKAFVAQVAFLPAMALAGVVLSAWGSGAALSFASLPLLPLALAIVTGYALSLPLQAFLCRLLPRVEPGVYPLRGATALTVLLKERLVETANVALSGTLAWPWWLRAAGMRVGRRAEISTIMEVTPELVEIADDCFFADGIYLGRPLLHRGYLHCARTTFQPRTFLGNHAVIPAGAELPSRILLGVCTVADPERIREDSGWFGHPAFELPRRERIEADERDTFKPPLLRVVNRALWEASRLLLPVLPAFLIAWWATTLPSLRAAFQPAAFHLLVLPGAAVATGLFLCLLTFATKWLLLGRMREEHHVLWSCWCSRWDILYEVWSAYARPVIECLEGTPWVAWWLRAMGARIGRRVVLGTSFAQLVDPDMLEIGDDATVSCHLQLHSFEDRVLKLGRSRIGEGATLAAGSLLLYGATVGEGTRVCEQSVIMKREHLLAGGRYEGAPTRPAREVAA